MKKKERIALSATLIASTFCLACAALVYAKSAPNLKAKGAPTVDSWTEKAYEAPTGESVGYKHYYLGCPGNYRTSDAEHNVDVTLEEITIPALNVIDSSEVTYGSEILNINESKIKYCDQSIDFYDKNSGGHAVFVEDQGHQAVFFSRSGNLTDGLGRHFPGGTSARIWPVGPVPGHHKISRRKRQAFHAGKCSFKSCNCRRISGG